MLFLIRFYEFGFQELDLFNVMEYFLFIWIFNVLSFVFRNGPPLIYIYIFFLFFSRKFRIFWKFGPGCSIFLMDRLPKFVLSRTHTHA